MNIKHWRRCKRTIPYIRAFGNAYKLDEYYVESIEQQRNGPLILDNGYIDNMNEDIETVLTIRVLLSTVIKIKD